MLFEYVNDLEDTSWHEPLRWQNGRTIRCLADIDYSMLTGWSQEMQDAWNREIDKVKEMAKEDTENGKLAG